MPENSPETTRRNEEIDSRNDNQWESLTQMNWEDRAAAARVLENTGFSKRHETVDSSFEKLCKADGENRERRVDAYLTRLDRIIDKYGNRAEQKLWQRSSEKLIIEPENIPEKYWQRQEQIMRDETGRSEKLNENERDYLTRDIQRSQRESIKSWADYLGSESSPYPLWFKVLAWDGVSRMGTFDKEKGYFSKRNKTTTAPYPKCDAEALGKAYETVNKAYSFNQNSETPGETENQNEEKLIKLAESSNFNKLYSEILKDQKTVVKTPEHAKDVRGEWLTYGADEAEKLSEAATGTGWCIAAPDVGRSYLNFGEYGHSEDVSENGAKFMLFHLEDPKTGLISETAAASVRLDTEGRVAEVSGLGEEQAIEDALVPTVEKKVRSLEGGEEYLEAFADKKELIRLDHKMQAGATEFSQKDINFIFEQEREIKNLDTYREDPRVQELKLYLLENCKQLKGLEVGWGLDLSYTKIAELPEGLKVGGNLNLSNTKITELPEGLEVGKDLYLNGSEITELPEGLKVGGILNLENTEITELPEGLKVGGRVIRN